MQREDITIWNTDMKKFKVWVNPIGPITEGYAEHLIYAEDQQVAEAIAAASFPISQGGEIIVELALTI